MLLIISVGIVHGMFIHSNLCFKELIYSAVKWLTTLLCLSCKTLAIQVLEIQFLEIFAQFASNWVMRDAGSVSAQGAD